MNARRYGPTAIALHWLMALGLLANFCLGLSMVDMSLSPDKLRFYSWHKWTGVTLFVLAGIRLCWRLLKPVRLDDMPYWQHIAARITHALLYLLMFCIPLSGWIMSSAKGVPTVYLGLWQLPDLVHRDPALGETLASIHTSLNMLLAALVVLHLLAALKHHVIDKDDVLSRMLPWAGSPPGASHD